MPAAQNDETDEEEEHEVDDRVGESHASQMATSMLRRAPDVPDVSAGKSSGLLQTKLFGKVKKPGIEGSPTISKLGKRKNGRDEEETYGYAEHGGEVKKVKTSKGIGLGIGGWADARSS
jgi:hypothetical protein